MVGSECRTPSGREGCQAGTGHSHLLGGGGGERSQLNPGSPGGPRSRSARWKELPRAHPLPAEEELPVRTEQVPRATAPGQTPHVVPDPPVGTTPTPNRSALCVAQLLISPRASNAGHGWSSLYLLLQDRPALTHAALTSHLRPPSTWHRARMG